MLRVGMMDRIRASFKESLEGLTGQGRCSVLLAFSGGRDSVTLLNLFLELASEQVELSVAYVNHNLRGEESLEEERFVRDYINSLNLPLYIHTVEPECWQEPGNESVEMRARRIRYSFFRRLQAEQGIDYIATAHNFNDRVETFFIQLLRGGGFETLSSIPARNGRVIRPLLEVSREEIDGYVEGRGLPYIEDSTNSKDIYRRNMIRNRVLPLFKEIYPAFESSFSHVFGLIEEEQALVRGLVRRVFKRLCVYKSGSVLALRLEGYHRLEGTLKKYLLKSALKRLGYPVRPGKTLFSHLTAGDEGYNFSKGKFRALSKGKLLWLLSCEEREGLESRKLGLDELPFSLKVSNFHFKLEVKKDIDKSAPFVFKYSMEDFPLRVRALQGNDRINTGRKSKKISRILSDNGIPPLLHHGAVVIETAKGMVAGFCLYHIYRVSSDYYVESESGQIIRCRYKYF